MIGLQIIQAMIGFEFGKRKADIRTGRSIRHLGLEAAVRYKGHQCPLRADSVKHCTHANAQPKVGNEQQIQPVPKLGLRAQVH